MTAEEFLKHWSSAYFEEGNSAIIDPEQIKELMIGFAIMHVQKCIVAACNNLDPEGCQNNGANCDLIPKLRLIRIAYSLEEIK